MAFAPAEPTNAVSGSIPDKLMGLEALRFTAAFAVLVWHYHHFYYTGTTLSGFVIEDQPFYSVLAPFYIDGRWGVHVFWCVSGFIFAWKYMAPLGAGEIPLLRFAILRISRLYPLHCLTLAAVAILQAAYFRDHGAFFNFPENDLKHFVLNLFFASYWGFQDGFSFNGPSWSVSAEIPVYFVFFFWCLLVGKRIWLATPLAFGAFLLIAILLRVWPRSAVLLAADFFYLGVLTCLLYTLISAQTRGVRMASCWIVFTVALLLLLATGLGWMDIEQSGHAMFPAMVLLFQLAIPAGNARVNDWLTIVGNMTYASYLLQFPVQLVVVQMIDRIGLKIVDVRGTQSFFVAYVLTVFALSRIAFIAFERPAQIALRRSLFRLPIIAGQRRTVPTTV